ncbi:MAG: hypothetical protein AB9869_36050 [Verrucomicrobiia bacterium]
MVASKPTPKRIVVGSLCLAAWLSTQTAFAVPLMTVDMTATTLSPGPGFQYEFSVSNIGAENVVVVDILNAPAADPLIAASLQTPVGFLGVYDGGVLRVTFLGDTQLFDAGATYSGFRFQSLASPGQSFTEFEAFNELLEISRGNVNLIQNGSGAPGVPDSGGTLALSALGLMTLVCAARAAKRPCSPS